MNDNHGHMRDLALDGLKGSPVVSYGVAVLNGWTPSDWAAILAAIYTLMVIGEKIWRWRWLQRIWLHFYPKPTPPEDPGVTTLAERRRHPEDE